MTDQPNPAVVPDPAVQPRRTYRVCGAFRVFGYEPGETFDKQLDVRQERRLLNSGAIEIHTPPKPAPPAETPAAKGDRRHHKQQNPTTAPTLSQE